MLTIGRPVRSTRSGRRWPTAALLGIVLLPLVPADTARSQVTPTVVGAPLVRLPFPQDDGTLTPYTFKLGYPLMTLVYDTLLWRDTAGVPQPWLASAVETSSDGRRVTVRLRDGARWHDGGPVTAADVAFTFAYVASHPHPRFSPEVSVIERVDTPDPRTVVFSLRRPEAGFSDQALADIPILPRHLWQGLPPGRAAPEGLPVGSGPYRLVEHRPGKRYRFEGTAGYFRGPPAVATIEVPIITTATRTIKALERREVDMIPVSLSKELAKRIDTVSIKVAEGPSYLGTVLMFNLRTTPFDRVEVRQAVSRALDLGRISRAVGTAVPAHHGYLHPESPFAVPDVLQTADGAAARAVLKGLGFPITVLAPGNDPVKIEAGRQVVQALRGAGATAELKVVQSDDLSRAVGEDGSPPAFQAAIWVSPVLAAYDPSYLSRLFSSDPVAAPSNFPGYRSAAFDEAIERVASTIDPSRRRTATADAVRLLATDVPVVPLFFAGGAFAYRPAVYDGWVFIKGTGILDKRSFVEPLPVTPRATTSTPGSEGGATTGLSATGLVALGVLGAAGALAIVAVVMGIRARRARF